MRSNQIKNHVLVLCVFSALQVVSLADVYYTPDQLFETKLEQIEAKVLKRLEERLDTFEQSLERKLGQQFNAKQKTDNARWLELDDKILVLKDAISHNSGAYFSSCRTVPSEFSNVFMVRPSGINTQPFLAYCEQRYFGGGWIVIHKRFDGSVNFTRDWTEYKEGFGEPDGEQWIGLDKIHKISRSGEHELLIVMKDFDGRVKMALYDGFQVDNEGTKYKLTVGRYVHGDAGDSLQLSNGVRFSTYDQDNDQHPNSCAAFYKSGWWFKNCMNTNLNGLYQQSDNQNKTMNWFDFRKDLQGLKEASMMIREKVKI